MSDIGVVNRTQTIIVDSAHKAIVVNHLTQKLIVNPVTQAVTVVRAGPQGPPGVGSDIPEPIDPTDDGKAPIADGGVFVLANVVRSATIFHLTPITQAAFNALSIPRDPSILYVIGDF